MKAYHLILHNFVMMGLIYCSAIVNGAEQSIDLKNAVVVVTDDPSPVERNVLDFLLDEVEKRTLIRWKVSSKLPETNITAIVIAKSGRVQSILGDQSHTVDAYKPFTKGEEGYRIVSLPNSQQPMVIVAGHDDRGIVFGCGRLLRELTMSPGKVSLSKLININTTPAYPIRGHQLGYRPKTNSYDAWSVPMWEQYIRDLLVFGTNAIELIPPRSDDDDTSPHFPLPQMDMMIQMSKLADNYDMDVWVWYPAIDSNYTNQRTLEKSLHEWSGVLSQLPRLDAVFVPGGDPGHTPPAILLQLLEKQIENLHQFHPQAEMWVSTQGFHKQWMDEFIQILQDNQPEWLDGIVFGPQNLIGLPELRERNSRTISDSTLSGYYPYDSLSICRAKLGCSVCRNRTSRTDQSSPSSHGKYFSYLG